MGLNAIWWNFNGFGWDVMEFQWMWMRFDGISMDLNEIWMVLNKICVIWNEWYWASCSVSRRLRRLAAFLDAFGAFSAPSAPRCLSRRLRRLAFCTSVQVPLPSPLKKMTHPWEITHPPEGRGTLNSRSVQNYTLRSGGNRSAHHTSHAPPVSNPGHKCLWEKKIRNIPWPCLTKARFIWIHLQRTEQTQNHPLALLSRKLGHSTRNISQNWFHEIFRAEWPPIS